jgi:hypothetical protein
VLLALPAQAQEFARLSSNSLAYAPNIRTRVAGAERRAELSRLKRRRDVLRNYLTTVEPASADYKAVKRSLGEMASKIESLEAEAFVAPPAPDAAPRRALRQEGDIDDLFAELLAAPTTGCPEPAEGPADDFELSYGYDHRLSPRNNDQGPRTQKGPLSFSYFPGKKRFTFGLGLDTFSSRQTPGAVPERVTGVGNASLNFSYKVAPEGASPIPLTLDYVMTVPSASVSKGLGRGASTTSSRAPTPGRSARRRNAMTRRS